MTVADGSVPKITMITAALNPGPEVRQTIESVLSQGYPNLEYIFVDGGSGPEAFAHVSPYLDRIELAGTPTRLRSNFFNGIKRLPVRVRS